MIRLCVLGPSGRMGAMVIELAGGMSGQLAVTGAVDRPDCEIIGNEIVPGVAVSSDFRAAMAEADVYVDLTVPEATRRAAEVARELGVAGVIGTTGLDRDAQRAIDQLADRAPVVVAANFSLGVNVLLGLAERAARALGPEFDLEIVEIHHRHKRDAPSGTALALADALAVGRGGDLRRQLGRAGDVGPRSDEEIGVLAVRGGEVPGEHTAFFFGQSERLEITHRTHSRQIFAQGALRAAQWVAGKPAGRYSMRDVLGL